MRFVTLMIALGLSALAGCQQEGTCRDGSLGCDPGRVGGNNGVGNNGRNNGDPVPQPADATARAVAGTWELTYVSQARNPVNRLVDVARVTWDLEIFVVQRNEFSGLYEWNGALRGGSLCVQTIDQFEEGSDACEELGAVTLGKCSGHACRSQNEQLISGHFDPETETMRIHRHDGGVYYVDEQRGYINVEAGLDNDAQPVDGTSPETCEKWCPVNLYPRSLLAEVHPAIQGETRQTTLVKLSSDRRSTDGLDDDEYQLAIGDAESAIAEVIGTWDVRGDLYVDAMTIGSASYELDIFEVVPLTEVGVYRWSGELTGNELCLAPSGDSTCQAFGPATVGRCTSGGCTDEGRFEASGRYDALRATFEMDQTNANTFHMTEDGWLHVELTFRVEPDTPLLDGDVPVTECERWCPWILHVDGTFEGDFAYTQGTTNRFSMQRQDP